MESGKGDLLDTRNFKIRVSTPQQTAGTIHLCQVTAECQRGGARNQRLIRFVDQIFVHPLNRIVWYKISVISTHTDTKTSVSARKAAYLTVNVTQFTHTGSKLFRDLCKTRQLPRLRGGQLYIAVGGRKVKLDWLCAAVLQSSDAIAPHCSAVAKTHCSIPTNSQTTVKLLPEAWSQDMDQDI